MAAVDYVTAAMDDDSLYNMSELLLGHLDPILPNTTTASPTTLLNDDVALSLRQTRFAVQTVLTPVVVIIGLLGNILNILVLLQPSMRSSTNVYILVLSIADSTYLVFNFALSILVCRKRGLSDSAYYFNPYGRFVSNFSGNVAVWVTVSFTVERYIAVCHPMRGKRWCTVSRAKLASLAIVVLSLINTLPTIFELEVVQTDNGLRCQYTDFANQFSYEIVYSWWYVTVFTFIPLICLAIFNIVLIRVLLVASRKRQELVLISSSRKSSLNRVKKPSTNGTANHSSSNTRFTASSNASPASSTPPNGFKNQKSSDINKSCDQDYSHHNQPQSCLMPTLKCHQYQSGYQKQNGTKSSSLNNTTTSTTTTTTITNTNLLANNSKRHSVGNNSSVRGSSRKDRGVDRGSRSRSPKSSDSNSNSNIKRQGKRMSREQNKVTLLLVTIVMIFFLCQLPWTALFLYKTYLSNNHLTGNQNHIKIAGNICNLLGLMNASGNFYLYSCFSKRFRKTFKSLVLFWRKKSNIFTSMV